MPSNQNTVVVIMTIKPFRTPKAKITLKLCPTPVLLSEAQEHLHKAELRSVLQAGHSRFWSERKVSGSYDDMELAKKAVADSK